MNNKKVYLSGRMSGLPEQMWRWRFASWEVLLQWENRDMRIVNPANTIIARHPWLYRLLGYRFTLWYDLRLLKRCTHICMIGKDWQLSRGARLERLKARQWNIQELEL